MDNEEAQKILAHGPQPIDTEDRRVAVKHIVSRLETAFGESVVAIGLYGSTARGADREYSDIEMFCVVRKPGEDRRLEWADSKGKYEIEVFGEDVVQRKAAELDEAWPVTHAVFASPKPIHGEPVFFATLRRRVFDHSEDQFHDVIRAIIVGEMYEGLGKVRNAMLSGTHGYLARVATRMVIMAELMVGLANRHIYTAANLATAESMSLTPRPAGHDGLCNMVMRGELNNPNKISEVVERYWESVIEWAATACIDLAPGCRWTI